MKHRIRNWKKCVFLLLYFALLIVFLIIGLRAENLGNYSVRNVFYSLTAFLVIMLPCLFYWLWMTRVDASPLKQAPVTVVKKDIRTTLVPIGEGNLDLEEIPTVTFLFPNQMMYRFDVNKETFSLVKVGDTGILAYKEYKNLTYYVSFHRD